MYYQEFETTKECACCGNVLPTSYFSICKTSGYQSYCKKCQSDYKKSNRESRRNADYKRMYGISLDQYNELLEEQNGCCAVCGTHHTKVLKNKLYVDHSHKTGKVRGLLCSQCNTGLGMLKDDFNICLEAAKYLMNNDQPD